MAKKRRQKRKITTSQNVAKHRQTRDLKMIARPRREALRRGGVLPSLDLRPLVRPDLKEVEDLRSVKNARKGRFVRFDGTPAGTQYKPVHNRVSGLFEGMRLSFSQPQKTVVCVRRKSRRRVLFALQKAGKGRRHFRRSRWSAQSYIRCK